MARIDDLLAQMRFREMPKRALLSIPFELADGFVIGVKGYGVHDQDCAMLIFSCGLYLLISLDTV